MERAADAALQGKPPHDTEIRVGQHGSERLLPFITREVKEDRAYDGQGTRTMVNSIRLQSDRPATLSNAAAPSKNFQNQRDTCGSWAQGNKLVICWAFGALACQKG